MESREFRSKVAEFISRENLISKDEKIVVAISGGADSVALLRVLMRLGYNCMGAHCNFHLRGEESMRDERFTRGLCERLGVDCKFVNFEVGPYAESHRLSLEMACRDLRYDWFEQLCEKHGYNKVAVAHHKDDDIETMLLNMFRGSGISGISGIKPINGRVVRPLLCVSRNEILAYLNDLRQDYVVDSTNLECDFARNKIRNIILPEIYRLLPNAETGISTTINNLKGDFLIFEDAVSDMLKRICVTDKNGVLHINKADLLKTAHPATALHEILMSYGFNSAQVLNMLSAEVGAIFRSNEFVAETGRSLIDVFPCRVENDDSVFEFNLSEIERLPIDIKVELSDNTDDFKYERRGDVAYFNEKIMGQTLTLRHWRTGDVFRPFGLKGRKKLSDYFNDNKFSYYDKKTVWLLCCGDEILWIVGHRAASAFKVTDADEKIVVLRYNAV